MEPNRPYHISIIRPTPVPHSYALSSVFCTKEFVIHGVNPKYPRDPVYTYFFIPIFYIYILYIFGSENIWVYGTED